MFGRLLQVQQRLQQMVVCGMRIGTRIDIMLLMFVLIIMVMEVVQDQRIVRQSTVRLIRQKPWPRPIAMKMLQVNILVVGP